jgi:hypothetical protein
VLLLLLLLLLLLRLQLLLLSPSSRRCASWHASAATKGHTSVPEGSFLPVCA